MFNGTPLAGKGNPTWEFGNAPETLTPWRNALLEASGPQWDRPASLAARAMAAISDVVAELADTLRRIGTRLFLEADEEAYWRGWQVTPLHGGLSRCYRDPRFGPPSALSDPNGRVPPGQSSPPDDGQ
jgi:hypothetical protein